MLTLAYSAKAQKRFIVRVIYKDGTVMGGQLLRATPDSLVILKGKNLLHVAVVASEIELIRIRRKRSIGQGAGIGALAGALVGGVIGYASYTPTDCGGATLFCFDFGPNLDATVGAVIGGMIGAGIGAATGSVGKEFKIEGRQSQYDLFANEFTKPAPQLKPKQEKPFKSPW